MPRPAPFPLGRRPITFSARTAKCCGPAPFPLRSRPITFSARTAKCRGPHPFPLRRRPVTFSARTAKCRAPHLFLFPVRPPSRSPPVSIHPIHPSHPSVFTPFSPLSPPPFPPSQIPWVSHPLNHRKGGAFFHPQLDNTTKSYDLDIDSFDIQAPYTHGLFFRTSTTPPADTTPACRGSHKTPKLNNTTSRHNSSLPRFPQTPPAPFALLSRPRSYLRTPDVT